MHIVCETIRKCDPHSAFYCKTFCIVLQDISYCIICSMYFHTPLTELMNRGVSRAILLVHCDATCVLHFLSTDSERQRSPYLGYVRYAATSIFVEVFKVSKWFVLDHPCTVRRDSVQHENKLWHPATRSGQSLDWAWRY